MRQRRHLALQGSRVRHPLLYQVNTACTLDEVERELGRRATLKDVPLALFEGAGFDWLWLLGVWQTGRMGQQVSRTNPTIRQGLGDVPDDVICGSPFAVRGYLVRDEWGGPSALEAIRERVARAGARLMLDFVPNHVALDHPWLEEHPEYFIHGTQADLACEPRNWIALTSRGAPVILAHGRDPYFPGWPDTLQLNYRHEGLRRAMIEQLHRIARACDGVRCDMAMLVQSDVFERTWGEKSRPVDGSRPATGPFWQQAIREIRGKHPGFTFMAEVYWDREWELQQEGFDFTYDKRLYDRLRSGTGRAVREHLYASPEYQDRSVRFLENHDEPRAASVWPLEVHRAAATIAFLVPGMRFIYDGQVEGRRAHPSMHVRRRCAEAPDAAVRDFYLRLLPCLKRPEVHDGAWRLWACRAAWDGNSTWENMIVFSWTLGPKQLLVAVNYAPVSGQCYVTLDLPGLAGATIELRDLMGDARYVRQGDGLRSSGLYLDMPAWGHHVFVLTHHEDHPEPHSASPPARLRSGKTVT
jgi:hypothetical protein